jgi:hypothetical protein
MKRTIGWIVLGVIAVGALLALPLVLVRGAWGMGYSGGMMGGMMGSGMMGNGFGFSPFGWMGMVLSWLISLAILALLITGVVWLYRSLATPGGPSLAGSTPTQFCANCGRGLQADWKVCPQCGYPLPT